MASNAMAEPAGLRVMKIEMPHHDSRTGISIWYSDGGGGDQTVVAENGVFYAVEGAIWADLQDGTLPVVMFSHGMGGTTRAQAWLTSGLIPSCSVPSSG